MPERRQPFPDLCRPGNLFAVFLIAELIVLVLLLAPGRIDGFAWRTLSLLSLFAQVTALWIAACLCLLRDRLSAMPRGLGFLTAYVLLLAIVMLASLAGLWLDGLLGLGALAPDVPAARVLIGNALLAALVGAAALRYFFVQVAWREQVESAAGARMQALEARIRPHFLFNALNTIASVVRRDPAAAERAIEDLSDLFRASLAKGEGTWPIAEELELCRRYVAIEQLRLGDKLAVTWDVAAIDGATPIPALALQPLIENAIQHGIQGLREGGTVSIVGAVDPASRAAIVVVRNPVPRRPPRRRGGAGHALENIRQRLMIRFAGRAKLDARREEETFVATLTWPGDATTG